MLKSDSFTKRPTKDDDEDKILHQMREFEQADNHPSAKLIKVRSTEESSTEKSTIGKPGSKRPVSKFSQTREKHRRHF